MIVVVVVRVAVVAAADVRAPDLLAQVAARRVGEERLHRRARVGDRPLALLAARLRGRRGAGRAATSGRPARSASLVEHERVALLVGEHVLAEGRVERREPLVDLASMRFLAGASSFAPARTKLRVVEPRRGAAAPASRLGRLGAPRRPPRCARRASRSGRSRRRTRRASAPSRCSTAWNSGVFMRRAADAVDRAARGSSVRPAPSSAAIVFSKVGGAGSFGDRVDLGQVLVHRGLERRLEVLDLARRRTRGRRRTGPSTSRAAGSSIPRLPPLRPCFRSRASLRTPLPRAPFGSSSWMSRESSRAILAPWTRARGGCGRLTSGAGRRFARGRRASR